MGAIAIDRSPLIIAAEINSIKEQTRITLLHGSIEIGRRLAEAKGLVKHGEWGEWLGQHVDYSTSTANNLMRIFDEYKDANPQALGNLSYTQAVALLGVPAEEREQFAQDTNAADLSVRDLQKAIKERDAAQKALLATEAKVQRSEREKDRLDRELSSKNAEMDALSARIADLEEQIGGPLVLEPAVLEKIPPEVEKELEQLRTAARSMGAAPPNEGVIKYRVHFESVVSAFKSLLSALAEVEDTNAEQYAKYRTATLQMLRQMSERLGSEG